MIIRRAEKKDLARLSEFAAKTFYQSYGWYNTAENMRNYVESHFSPSQLEKEICDPASVYLIADENGISGYVKLGGQQNQDLLKTHSHSEIERIYVDETLQRSGIGKKLLQAVIDLAIQRGNSHIWLGVWQKNEKAIRFYQKNNFTIIGTTQFVLGDDVQDDFIMAVDLRKN